MLQEFLGEKAYNTYAKTKNLPPYGQTEAPAGGGAPGGGGSAPHAMPRSDVQGGGPASVRYNNPGAQYPSKEAARFGGNGYGVIGGGHLIQKFDDPVHGAASNMDLFYRKYTGEPLGQAGARWTGNNSFGVPGFPSNMIVTKEMMADKKFGIALMQAIAKRETGHAYPMTDAQWEAAHRLFMESTTSKGAPGGGGNIDKALDAMRQKDQSQIPWLSNPRLIRSPRYQQSYDGTKNYSTSETNVHSLIVNGGAKPMVTDDAYGVARDTVPALDRGQKVIQSTQGAN